MHYYKGPHIIWKLSAMIICLRRNENILQNYLGIIYRKLTQETGVTVGVMNLVLFLTHKFLIYEPLDSKSDVGFTCIYAINSLSLRKSRGRWSLHILPAVPHTTCPEHSISGDAGTTAAPSYTSPSTWRSDVVLEKYLHLCAMNLATMLASIPFPDGSCYYLIIFKPWFYFKQFTIVKGHLQVQHCWNKIFLVLGLWLGEFKNGLF